MHSNFVHSPTNYGTGVGEGNAGVSILQLFNLCRFLKAVTFTYYLII